MAITVGDIYTAFPTFKPKDMIDLMGTEKFNGRSEVSLSKIAHYKGGMAQELSIFTAKKEGKTFTNMLSQGERERISEQGKVKTDETRSGNDTQKPLSRQIPMDTSVFDIKREQA